MDHGRRSAEITRLGEGLDDRGEIAPEALERTVAVIAGMADEARRHGAAVIVAVGTAGLRIARNGREAAQAVRDRVGFPIEIIPGDEESRLGYLAVASGLGLGEESLVICDTGGGSTEFTFGCAGHLDERVSLDVGAVGYTERYRLAEAVPDETLNAVMARIADDLVALDGRQRPQGLVGMGGTITNITAVQHKLATTTPAWFRARCSTGPKLTGRSSSTRPSHAEDRRSIVGLQPKRADVILAGACIVRTVMEKLDQRSLTVSDRGLRHGLLLDRFGERVRHASWSWVGRAGIRAATRGLMLPGLSAKWNRRATIDYWAGNPWTNGSYSYWKVGQYTKFAGAEREIEGACHFAGEHTSIDFQGYLNGAVETGQRAAGEVITSLG